MRTKAEGCDLGPCPSGPAARRKVDVIQDALQPCMTSSPMRKADVRVHPLQDDMEQKLLESTAGAIQPLVLPGRLVQIL